MENAELEYQKAQIALALQQQCTNALISDLATARVEIATLQAKVKELTPVAEAPKP